MIKADQTTLDKNSSGLPEVDVRGADPERWAAIVACAETVFLEDGFQGASMAAIAMRSGCSKGTLYNYFISKEELFLACVAKHCAGFRNHMATLTAGDGDVRETLTQIGERYVEFVSSDDTVRKFRMIVAEAERAPDLARAFYETGPRRGSEMLAEYLERAVRGGSLKPMNYLRGAHHFFGLCYDRHSKARLCNYEPPPSRDIVEEDVAEAVRVFMAAYA